MRSLAPNVVYMSGVTFGDVVSTQSSATLAMLGAVLLWSSATPTMKFALAEIAAGEFAFFALGARGVRIVAARARHAYPCQASGCRLASVDHRRHRPHHDNHTVCSLSRKPMVSHRCVSACWHKAEIASCFVVRQLTRSKLVLERGDGSLLPWRGTTVIQPRVFTGD